MNTLLKKIYSRQVMPSQSDQMLAMGKANQDTACISHLILKRTITAHKTGELTYVRSNVSIVYARHPFLLSFFV